MNIKDLSFQELEQQFKQLDIASFRVKQVWQWLYQKRVQSFEQMSNLSKDLREKLAEQFDLSWPEIHLKQKSKDRTVKYLLKLADAQSVETVLIPTKKRQTLCMSTQVGCAIGCRFCASGLEGLKRNLTAGEIVDQLLLVLADQNLERVNNIVFMGIGEPFQNLENLFKAIDVINDPQALGVGARKITVSTSGIVHQFDRFADYDKQVELAVSLHAPTDALRNQLVPINKKYPLKVLLTACREYVHKTNRQITFEYVMLKGVNDSADLAQKLANQLQGFCCKVNLIPFNGGSEITGHYEHYERYECSALKDIEDFAAVLGRAGVQTTIRTPRGRDISAACGQLRHSA